MLLNEIENKLIGNWTGENLLRLSWMTPPEYYSASTLSAAKAVGGKFLAVKYTWQHENTPHEGLLLLGCDSKLKIVNATWADSWHSSVKPMPLCGKINDSGIIELLGAYEVPNSHNWIWRIVITPEGDDALLIEMYNCSPEGAEDLAVQAEYERTN